MSLADDEKLFWDILSDNKFEYIPITGKNLADAVKWAQQKHRVPKQLAIFMMHLAETYAERSSYRGYTFKEDMIQEGVHAMLGGFKSFDCNRSDNVFAYLTILCKSGFMRFISQERKQSDLKSLDIV